MSARASAGWASTPSASARSWSQVGASSGWMPAVLSVSSTSSPGCGVENHTPRRHWLCSTRAWCAAWSASITLASAMANSRDGDCSIASATAWSRRRTAVRDNGRDIRAILRATHTSQRRPCTWLHTSGRRWRRSSASPVRCRVATSPAARAIAISAKHGSTTSGVPSPPTVTRRGPPLRADAEPGSWAGSPQWESAHARSTRRSSTSARRLRATVRSAHARISRRSPTPGIAIPHHIEHTFESQVAVHIARRAP